MYRRKSFGAISLVLLALMLLTIDLVVKKLFDHFQFKIRACCTAFFVVLFSNWWYSIVCPFQPNCSALEGQFFSISKVPFQFDQVTEEEIIILFGSLRDLSRQWFGLDQFRRWKGISTEPTSAHSEIVLWLIDLKSTSDSGICIWKYYTTKTNILYSHFMIFYYICFATIQLCYFIF